MPLSLMSSAAFCLAKTERATVQARHDLARNAAAREGDGERTVRKVLIYSLLLIAGLIGSQFLGGRGESVIRLATTWALSFIMIHVGYEFEIDKSQPRRY